MDEAKKARLAWAATGRSVSMLDTIVRSGKPAGVIERLAAAVTVKAPADEKQAGGYEIDTRVADAVFTEHCEAMKASVEDEPESVEAPPVEEATATEEAATEETEATASEDAAAIDTEDDDELKP